MRSRSTGEALSMLTPLAAVRTGEKAGDLPSAPRAGVRSGGYANKEPGVLSAHSALHISREMVKSGEKSGSAPLAPLCMRPHPAKSQRASAALRSSAASTARTKESLCSALHASLFDGIAVRLSSFQIAEFLVPGHGSFISAPLCACSSYGCT
ncbi:hypothetical protein AAFF_G00404040 [Aldrovandia affinis]|uniref:Uncharacterized protein n=1 Tax=Aldrovandia affinis TaxID=143900 RepID=A0AAD7T7P3_9TELE|nr:hypothetical protein AAFF_G00404040 [Aldrovandia affinis]